MEQQETPLNREKHFTIRQLANRWGYSYDTVRREVNGEPGVLAIANPQPQKRTYKTRRIPESVASRIEQRLKRNAKE